jgi:hypothetical protein
MKKPGLWFLAFLVAMLLSYTYETKFKMNYKCSNQGRHFFCPDTGQDKGAAKTKRKNIYTPNWPFEGGR